MGQFRHSDNAAMTSGRQADLACPKSANSRSRRSATCAGRGGRSIGLGPGVKRILSTGAYRSPAIPRLHLPASIDKKMIEILDANQTEPRILHVRNNVECNC
jgi:hypothetical protein